ncbi:MAG: hypothetical protein WKF44_10075 [Rubrobacteraceae bacterium]
MILGGELLPAARFLDWLEVALRKLWQLTQDIWRSSPLGKAVVVAVGALLVAAFMYLTYWLFFGG